MSSKFIFLKSYSRHQKSRLKESILVFLSGSRRHFDPDERKSNSGGCDFKTRVEKLRKKSHLFSEFGISYPRRQQLNRSEAKKLCRDFIAKELSNENDEKITEKKVRTLYKSVQRLAFLLEEPASDVFVGEPTIFLLLF